MTVSPLGLEARLSQLAGTWSRAEAFLGSQEGNWDTQRSDIPGGLKDDAGLQPRMKALPVGLSVLVVSTALSHCQLLLLLEHNSGLSLNSSAKSTLSVMSLCIPGLSWSIMNRLAVSSACRQSASPTSYM